MLVMCLADFFLEDSVFIVYCHDRMHPEDMELTEAGIVCCLFTLDLHSLSVSIESY